MHRYKVFKNGLSHDPNKTPAVLTSDLHERRRERQQRSYKVPALQGTSRLPSLRYSRVRILVLQFFSFTPLRRLRPSSKAPNTAIQRLLGGRMVSVATLLVLVSRLSWGSVQIRSAIKCRGQPLKTREGSLESGRMGNTSPATKPP